MPATGGMQSLPESQPAVVPSKARSISRWVWEDLDQAARIPKIGMVAAVFERACHLAFPGDDYVAVVLPEIGNGPLNIVLDGRSLAFSTFEVPAQASLSRRWLELGELRVPLDGAAIWEPRPDWEQVRAHITDIRDRLFLLATLTLELAPPDSLASFLRWSFPSPGAITWVLPSEVTRGRRSALRSAVTEATSWLSLGWTGDEARLQAGASRLAGLGSGLTPAGDDFLMGVMLWAWLAHPCPERLCWPLLDASISRTTALSVALLRASARGECSSSWQHLLGCLLAGSESELRTAVRAVLAHGHTSGADALAGFVWMAMHQSD